MMFYRPPNHLGRPWSHLLLLLMFARNPENLGARSPSAGQKFDGPAELPRVYVGSSMADTPAPGKTHFVRASDDLQQSLNHSSCGDTLQLEAGATFTGLFHLPQKKCDDSHWIILRTSASD